MSSKIGNVCPAGGEHKAAVAFADGGPPIELEVACAGKEAIIRLPGTYSTMDIRVCARCGALFADGRFGHIPINNEPLSVTE